MKKKLLIPILLLVATVPILVITAIAATGENKQKRGLYVTLDGDYITYDPDKPFYYADPEGNYDVVIMVLIIEALQKRKRVLSDRRQRKN